MAASSSSDLWGNLPPELVSCVFTHLPIPGILQSRAISKRHRSWVGSVQFLEEYTVTPPRPSWLIFFPRPGLVCGYDPSLNTWMDLPCEFLSECRPLASAAGLICVVPRPVEGTTELLVCNPVTGSSLPIPRPQAFSRFFFLAVGMMASRNRSGFKLVVAGSELVADTLTSFSLSTSVFDSETWTWSAGGGTTVDAPISTCKATSEGGQLFIVVASLELVAYNEELQRWSRVNLPVRGLTCIKLVDRLGKLVLIARTEENQICLWELKNQSSSEWTELDTMPACVRDELFGSIKIFACLGGGDVAYFSTMKCPSILVYRFSSRAWSWAGSCKHFDNPHYNMVRGICVEPRLDTTPC